VLSALAHLLLAPLPHAEAFPTGRSVCGRSVPDADGAGTFAYARQEINDEGVLRETALTVHTRDFGATWDVQGGRRTLRSFTLEPWAPPAAARYPLTIEVRVDGRPVARRTFARSTIILVRPDSGAPDAPSRSWPRHPAVAFADLPTDTEIFGASSIELAVLDDSGARVGNVRLELPRWAAISAFAEKSFPPIEAERLRGACKPVLLVRESG
jgi:hypothetical protein